MKDDLISRQAAIKTLEKGLPSEPLKSKYTEGITVGFGLAITWIEQLPAVQPQPEEFEWCHDCKEYDQEAHCCHRWTKVIRQTVEELKEAQPEIIRCKGCKYHSHDAEYGRDWCNRTSGVLRVKPDDFCSRAERRTDSNGRD